MRVVVIGNGIAGIIFAKTLRELNPEASIRVFTDEKYHYYPRPNLVEFVAGNIPYERMFAFPPRWYEEQEIEVFLEKPVVRILAGEQKIETDDGKYREYDRLLLADGAHPFIPPFQGVEKKGVFTLRNIDDALAILDYLERHNRVIIVGGGLLGLEIARALKKKGGKVKVVEFFDYLLPRQLDPQGGSVLKQQIEGLGIEVELGIATEEILGNKEVRGIRIKGGREIQADMSVIAAGIRPNLDLARKAELKIDKGIVVDDFMKTSDSQIYAAGDNTQHKNKLYGIIPAAFDQARIAAANVAGQSKTYEGTIPSNTLKVIGLDLTAIGMVNPEKETSEEFRTEIPEKGIYKKIVIRNNRIVGAIWMGTKQGISQISKAIAQGTDIKKWKKSILEEDFDFSLL